MKNVWSNPLFYFILMLFISAIFFFVRFFIFYDAAKNIVPVGEAVFGVLLLVSGLLFAKSEDII